MRALTWFALLNAGFLIVMALLVALGEDQDRRDALILALVGAASSAVTAVAWQVQG